MYFDGRSDASWLQSEAVSGDWSANSSRPRYRFVDFFAGLGGFHVGLSRLGHECVFACEVDDALRNVYRRNFGIVPAGDIRQVDPAAVPEHEVLCAGFPCQPFSLAGKKKGAACPKSGKLIDDVFRIVGFHRPRYVFLENVPNVLTIANGEFWNYIQTSFLELGYRVEHRIYSPLQFGLPQQRYRLFIVAARSDMGEFSWPAPAGGAVRSLSEFIDPSLTNERQLEPAKMAVLERWNELIAELPALSSATIIASEFGATYPLDGLPSRGPWRHYRGAFGSTLADACNQKEAIARLPHYAASNGGCVPHWMRPYVKHSRALYECKRAFIDNWKHDLVSVPNSWQKLEWRGDRARRSIWHQTIQFRASGIRVMRPHMAPSLIAMTPTQTPIVGSQRRYLGVREAAALQALDGLSAFPDNHAAAFKALGNAVNAHIVYQIGKAVLG